MADARCMAVEPSEACLSRAAPAWTRRLAHDRWTPLGWILGDIERRGETFAISFLVENSVIYRVHTWPVFKPGQTLGHYYYQ